MREGTIIYNGPTEEALSYFGSIGLRCPPKLDVADFLVSVSRLPLV